MDKRQLQTYAVWAKENLERQIEVSLKTLGIHGDQEISKAKRAGDFTIIEGDANSYPASLLGKRNSIVELVREKGFRNVIEEFAYTWFNRFVALRYMEIHDYLPHGFRVLSNRSGGVEPEILKNLSLVKAELRLDMEYCASLKAQGRTEELFRYVLLRQCGMLSEILPMLFERDSDCLELLLPKSLLIGDTVLTTGSGGIYPAGLVVGTVKELHLDQGGFTEYGIMDPAVQLTSLRQVFVIKGFEGEDEDAA